jgi:hypothetical protein
MSPTKKKVKSPTKKKKTTSPTKKKKTTSPTKRTNAVAASVSTGIAIANPGNQQQVAMAFPVNGNYSGASASSASITCTVDHPLAGQFAMGPFAPSGANTWSCNFNNIPVTNGQFAELTAELFAADGTLLASAGIQIIVSS